VTPDAERRASLRVARLGLITAAETGDAHAIDFALVTYVGALYATSFSMVTIRALVEAALDAGLPPDRRPADRGRRAEAITRWMERTARLLAELPPTTPRRPGGFAVEGDADAAQRTDGSA
jgi:hypothetical protein